MRVNAMVGVPGNTDPAPPGQPYAQRRPGMHRLTGQLAGGPDDGTSYPVMGLGEERRVRSAFR
jgi:hypothetical protein